MTGMFKVSDPSQARGNSVTAREILDKASNDMGTGLAKDPEVQSQMMQVMASTYENLGLYPRAHELAKRALDSRLSLLGPDDPKTLESMAQLGSFWIAKDTMPSGETGAPGAGWRAPRSRSRETRSRLRPWITSPLSWDTRVITTRRRNWSAKRLRLGLAAGSGE
jgi:hypothetical protein